MPHVYILKDGSVRTIFDMRGAMEIIEETAGYEIRQYLEDNARDYEAEIQEYEQQISALDKEMDELRDDHRATICDIREELEAIHSLLDVERLDRKKLISSIHNLIRQINREL